MKEWMTEQNWQGGVFGNLPVSIEVEVEATHPKNTTTTNPQHVLVYSQILEKSLLRVPVSCRLGKI